MPDPENVGTNEIETAMLAASIQSFDSRISELEKGDKKGPFKSLTENAGSVGLLLGLILTLASLYDVFVAKPEADRISAIAQFNQAVNSAIQIRQELIQQSQTNSDQGYRLALMSLATPRILNSIATAKAILPELPDKDVGVPQLITLITESVTAGDLDSAKGSPASTISRTNCATALAFDTPVAWRTIMSNSRAA